MNDINIYIYSCIYIYGLNQSFFFYSYNIFLLLTRNIINYVNFIFFLFKLFSRKYASAFVKNERISFICICSI